MSLKSLSEDKKAIFLFGPTAVGKTRLLYDFFSGRGEVVNADSVQVYRGLDVGSAKADAETQRRIPHHLIDILDPWESYNVADFIRLADAACDDIRSRNMIPVISGGTAFYFKHFLYGLSEAPACDPETRQRVASYIEEAGLAKAHERLASVDPVSAARINVNDGYRISRALEVYETCGRPLSDFALPSVPRDGMKVLSIGLCRDKSVLDERIRLRVDIMFREGIIDEIRHLLLMGANPGWQSMHGIGYHEFLDVVYTGDASESVKKLENLTESEIEAIAEKIVMNSVHYAKRQMTFFRSFSDVTWTDPQNAELIRKLVDEFVG